MSMLEKERNTVLLLIPQEPRKPPEKLLPYVHTARTTEEWLTLGIVPFREIMVLPEDDDGEPYPSWEMCEFDIDGYLAQFEVGEILEEWGWGDALDGHKDTRYFEQPVFALALIDAGVDPKNFRGVDATLQKYFDAEVALASGDKDEFRRLVDEYLSDSPATSSECVVKRKANVLGISETDMLLEEVAQFSETMDLAVMKYYRPVQWIQKARDANEYSLLLGIAIRVVDGVNDVLRTDWTNKKLPKGFRYIDRDADWLARVEVMFGYFLERLGSMRGVICDELFKQNMDSSEDLRRLLLLISEKKPSKLARIEKLMKKHMN